MNSKNHLSRLIPTFHIEGIFIMYLSFLFAIFLDYGSDLIFIWFMGYIVFLPALVIATGYYSFRPKKLGANVNKIFILLGSVSYVMLSIFTLLFTSASISNFSAVTVYGNLTLGVTSILFLFLILSLEFLINAPKILDATTKQHLRSSIMVEQTFEPISLFEFSIAWNKKIKSLNVPVLGLIILIILSLSFLLIGKHLFNLQILINLSYTIFVTNIIIILYSSLRSPS